ncbi:glycoside hydrolase family 32 protein [uncultured Psychrosphaera sp.]|uniref:glycoside hydrolase family 32 protein n=1 Tax=uncultured Psychrosphaera sp. TaxID=1403522 RepID=UPI0030FC43AB
MKHNNCTESAQWRPSIHFSPEKNWINDPNGMVYFEGVYHLFYQYNPDGDRHANMHWGHATSTNLVNWQHHEIGIYADPDGLGYIFSGGAVVDIDNTSGLGNGKQPPLVATFTHHSEDEVQVQSLAYSQDGGFTWQEYANNPVLPNLGIKDFRDPKVIWDEINKQWVMALAAGQEIQFFVSNNLINWQLVSAFGEGVGAHGGVWECPDLFPLTTPSGQTKWVLLVSINPGGPNEGSATQYFIGDFDGQQFTSEQTETLWLDYGPDNYAGVTWDGLQTVNNKRIFIAWMSNWIYANEVPTHPWRGAMTLPRELTLVETTNGLALANMPSNEILKLRSEFNIKKEDKFVVPEDCAYEVVWTFDRSSGNNSLTLANSENERLVITYDVNTNMLLLDRRQSGWTDHGFAQVAKAPLKSMEPSNITVSIFIDKSSAEVFCENGLTTLTSTIFPSRPYRDLTTSRNSVVKCFKLLP